MKTFRVISLVLVLATIFLFCTSCNNGKVTATISIKFVSLDAQGKEVVHLEHNNYKIEGTKDQKPTVLMAAEKILKEYEKPYELTSDGYSISSVFDKVPYSYNDESYGYYGLWKCTINGKDSDSGRQSITDIYEDDQIVFKWTEGKLSRQDTALPESTDNIDETKIVETEQKQTTAVTKGDFVD